MFNPNLNKKKNTIQTQNSRNQSSLNKNLAISIQREDIRKEICTHQRRRYQKSFLFFFPPVQNHPPSSAQHTPSKHGPVAQAKKAKTDSKMATPHAHPPSQLINQTGFKISEPIFSIQNRIRNHHTTRLGQQLTASSSLSRSLSLYGMIE